ncbi:MAG: hypothetical protein JO281_02225 [Pseudonocardiales bacterium]|nr:hypothetical protein [Pseudonocardiales bacterium]
MRRDQRAKVAKSCGHILGVSNLILLVFVEPTALTLSLAVALTPFTLAMALRLTAFLACGVLSLALGDRRDRSELLACAIGAVQPSGAGEKYREAMLAEIRAAPSDRVRAIAANLMTAAPRTILATWVRIPRPLWERARKTAGASTGHSGS